MTLGALTSASFMAWASQKVTLRPDVGGFRNRGTFLGLGGLGFRVQANGGGGGSENRVLYYQEILLFGGLNWGFLIFAMASQGFWPQASKP